MEGIEYKLSTLGYQICAKRGQFRLTTKLSGADRWPRKAAHAYPRPLQRLVRRHLVRPEFHLSKAVKFKSRRRALVFSHL